MKSPEQLKVLFHPAALLTIGDTLALVNQLTGDHHTATGTMPRATVHEVLPSSTGHNHQGAKTKESRAKPLAMREQLALDLPVTSRVPQRCGNCVSTRRSCLDKTYFQLLLHLDVGISMVSYAD